MSALNTAILVVWVVFWVYWLASAFTAKSATARGIRGRPFSLIIILAGALVIRSVKVNGVVHSPVLHAVGVVVFISGLAFAVWARVHIGRNWGMPMTQKDEPELVTSGPYRVVRHPIYSGILLGLVGTALATRIYWLVPAAVVCVYFVYCARVEERLLTSQFPAAYPSYRAHTKMLIPFVL
jgi:protein-S-isoprenylcysteine O-methyltransferase Ste14